MGVFFSIAHRKHVLLETKFSQSMGKYGKLYASKEKPLEIKNTFMIPKPSPLTASAIFHLMLNT